MSKNSQSPRVSEHDCSKNNSKLFHLSKLVQLSRIHCKFFANLLTITKEIINGNFYFLRSDYGIAVHAS